MYKLCEYCKATPIPKSLDFCDKCFNYLKRNGIKWKTARDFEAEKNTQPKFEDLVLEKLTSIENLLKGLK